MYLILNKIKFNLWIGAHVTQELVLDLCWCIASNSSWLNYAVPEMEAK